MNLGRAGTDSKGWIGGEWNWGLPVAIGYANSAIDAPHRHERQTEIYLVASGSANAIVDGVEVVVRTGDVLVVEPQEVRTFTDSSTDYTCFVLMVGGDGSPDRIAVG